MADEQSGLSSVDLRYGPSAPEEGVSWTDYLKGMQSGAASQIVGGTAALIEDASRPGGWMSDYAGDVRRDANRYAQEKLAETSPKFQRRVGANFFYGDGPSIWEEGVWGSLLAKAAVSAPSIIATAVPGGLVGRAVMSARAGLAVAQGAGGALTTGSIINEIYNEFDKLPDAKLREASPLYAGYRNTGMSEVDARNRIRSDVTGVEPYLIGAISALIPGAEGALASRLGGHAAKGTYLGTAAKRALGEGGQEFFEESTGELAQQRALQPFTLNDTDWMKALEAGLQGAAVGAPLGAVSGIAERVGGGEQKPAVQAPGSTQQVNIPTPDSSLDTGAVDPAQQVALNDKLGATPAAAPAATPAATPPVDPGVSPPASPVNPNAVSTAPAQRPKGWKKGTEAWAEPQKPAAPAAPATQQVTPAATPTVTPVETPAQEAARLVTELTPGLDPATNVALEEKAAPAPAPHEIEAAQLVKDLTQPAAQSEPAVANPVPTAPSVSSVQEGPVATGSPVASPEVRTPPQEQVSTTVEPPATQTPYDRALALIEAGTPLSSVNAVQNKVGVAYGTAVKLFNKLKAEGRATAPVPTPPKQKAPPSPSKAPSAVTEGAPATTLSAAESARPEASVIEAQPVTQEVTKAPKAAALKEKIAAEPARKVEVSDEEKARLVAASDAKVPKRKILPPGTLEARAKAEAAEAQMIALQGEINNELVKAKKAEKNAGKETTGRDKNLKRVEATNNEAETANNIIQQGTPNKGVTITKTEQKEALKARLEAIVAEAEKNNIKIREINREGLPAPLVYLAYARRMVRMINDGSGTYADLNRFLADELDVRAGGGSMMRETLKEMNAKDSRRAASSAPFEKLSEDGPSRIEEAVEVKAGADEVSEDDTETKSAASIGPVESTSDENDNAYDEDGNYAGQVRERPQVKVEEDAVRGYAGVKEGSVKTEKVVGGRRKLNIPVTAPKGAALLQKVKQMTTQQVTEEAATSVDGKPMAVFTDDAKANKDIYDKMAEAQANATYTTDVASVLGDMSGKLGHWSGTERAMSSFIAKRVANLVGDTKVYVVNPDHMARLWGVPENQIDFMAPNQIPGGLYFHDENAIYLNRVLHDVRPHIALHEAIHAATVHAMDSDADLKSEIRTLMAIVRNTAAGNQYGMTNEYEFMAEAMSNPEFQAMLRYTELAPDVARQYGLHSGRALRSAWDFFMSAIRRALGFPPGVYTALDAALRLGDYTLTQAEANGARPSNTVDLKVFPSMIGDTVRRITQQVKGAPVTEDELISDAGPKLMGLRTFDNISRAADQYFGGADNNPVRVAQEITEKMRVHGQDVFERSTPLIESLYQLEKKHAGKDWDNFANLSHDATMLNVHPDKPLNDPANAHLSKRKDAQAIAEWKNLNERWNALPDELKQAWGSTTKYYRDMQNAMAFGILKNRVLKTLAATMSEAELDALARRYFNGISTDADAATLGKEMDSALKAIDELKSIKGPYFPQMRRGDWAVLGRVQFSKPNGATKVDDTTFSFKDEKAATDYVNRVWRESGIKATVKRQFVDPKTGLTYFTDDQGEKVKASSKEPEAERRYLVSVQDEFLEYHATQAEAQERAAEIGKTMKKVAVEERRVQPQTRGDLYSEQLRSVMKRIEQKDAYKSLTPEARAETVQALNELSYQLFGATRIQSRRLPRRYVAGASKDVTRNAMEYSQSVAGYIGKLRYQPELDAAVKQMHDYIEKNRYQDRQRTVARSRIANEVDRRLTAPPAAAISKMDHGIQRALTASFLDKLASLSYSVINSTQTITNTMPLLASRHGWARSTKAMTQAYSMLGGARNIGTGLANVGRAVRNTQQVSLMEPVRNRLAKHGPEYVQLFDYLRERGVVSSDAGMEVIKAVKAGNGFWGGVDKGLNYGDAIARALPEAVEVNNRVASAVASYMLARSKGVGVDQARRYAYDTVNGTQFNYSQTNAPAFMNNPMARLVFQFKKYAQGQYQLLGEQVGKALHGATRQEKMEGIKALVNFAATTTLFAGALGLPTEPIKYMLMAASVFGLGYSYDDLERDVRAKAVELIGKNPAEMLTRGVTRGLPAGFAFDLSSRMGLNDLTTFGQPRENTKDAWGSWLWDTVKGAPISLGTDMIRGANMIATGDIEKGVELMLPFKQVADTLTTYRLATEGKRSGMTGRQTLDPLTGPEAFVRSLGFKPGREADTLERDNAYYTVKKERMGERQQLVSKWLNAKGDEKADAWKRIVKYNAGVDEVARITMGQLTTAQKRRASEERRGTIIDGKRVTKDDRGIYDTGNIYNVK